jgi:hypothetical protein
MSSQDLLTGRAAMQQCGYVYGFAYRMAHLRAILIYRSQDESMIDMGSKAFVDQFMDHLLHFFRLECQVRNIIDRSQKYNGMGLKRIPKLGGFSLDVSGSIKKKFCQRSAFEPFITLISRGFAHPPAF